MSEEIREVTEGEHIESISQRQLYCKILGVSEIPRSPEEMPSQIFIPKEALGDLEKSILATGKDGLERSQMLGWDSEQQRYVYSDINIGTEHGVKPPLSPISRYQIRQERFSAFLGLIEYHTHPHNIYSTEFSRRDIVGFKLFQRSAYMYVVGHLDGVTALLQTARTARMPVSSIFEALRTYFRFSQWEEDLGRLKLLALNLGFEMRFDKLSITEPSQHSARLHQDRARLYQEIIRAFAKPLENEGYGYYIWKAGDITDVNIPVRTFLRTLVRRGSLKNGLTLQRVLAK